MHEPTSPLLLEFLSWISSRPRTYTETMDAWRTSCPHQSVWEDALIEGFVETAENQSIVILTTLGRAALGANLKSEGDGHGPLSNVT